ncbi:MAG: hypothetical protein ABI895_24610 [Deltaproteobacteria bacterium]
MPKTQDSASSRFRLASIAVALAATGCGNDDGQDEADRIGVAAECTVNDECPSAFRGETPVELICLRDFKGGYCGVVGCRQGGDCPDASACIAHTDGNNYCFHTCTEKVDCNANRTPDNEANCSSNVTFVDDATKTKACIPPSSSS